MTITALLDLTIKPESVAGAKGIIENVLVDVTDETHILVIEKWESLERDSDYRAWRATPAGASALSSITASRTLTRFAAV